MSPKNPPALAAWVLKHVVVGRPNEALAGDLLEEFRSGRSSVWYWRQVLIVMALQWSRELSTHWAALLFAALWTLPEPLFRIFLVARLAESPFVSQRWHLRWPYSTMADLAFFNGCSLLYLWSGLALCFVLSSLATRTIRLGRLIRGLWVSMLVYIATFAGLIALATMLPPQGFVLQPVVAGHTRVVIVSTYSFLPIFLALLAAIWSLFPRGENTILSVAD
jgi:hypothetical protein